MRYLRLFLFECIYKTILYITDNQDKMNPKTLVMHLL